MTKKQVFTRVKHPPPTRPFRIFEGGVGRSPVGLLRKAARSEQRGLRKRVFVATDIETIDLQGALKKASLRKKPPNLTIRKQNSLNALAGLRPESQDLVVECFLLNNLHQVRDPLTGKTGDGAVVFIRLAERALKPGGRIVLVQDNGSTADYQAIAHSMGLEFHAILIPEKKALKSSSPAIRARATVQKRQRITTHDAIYNPGTLEMYSALLHQGSIREPHELYIPTIMLLKKPFRQKTVKIVTKRMNELGLDGLNQEEQRIVREIIG
jgi:hypothetical protein